MTESLIDQIGRERAEELMAKAVRDAVADLHARGLPSIGIDDEGRVCKDYADGTRVYVETDK